MTKTDFAKSIVSFVVGAGTNKIVKAIINNNISPEKVTDKVAVEVAAFVISMMAANACKQFTDAKIDEMIAYWQKVQAQVKEARSAS